jgi:hypothetical protein
MLMCIDLRGPIVRCLYCLNAWIIRHPYLLIWLADLMYPDGHQIYYVHQIILARQLVEYVVDVKAAEMPSCTTPSHTACCTNGVNNLKFLYFLLKSGADPNARIHGCGALEGHLALPKF